MCGCLQECAGVFSQYVHLSRSRTDDMCFGNVG